VYLTHRSSNALAVTQSTPTATNSFVILVAGTLVYGRGDEAATKEEIEEAVAAGLIPAPVDAAEAGETAPLLQPSRGAAAAAAIPARSVPVGIRAGSLTGAASPHPHGSLLSGSFSNRATMTITHGSYSRGLTGYGSLPRGSLGAGSLISRGIRDRRGEGSTEE
jgi:hypothetical protein